MEADIVAKVLMAILLFTGLWGGYWIGRTHEHVRLRKRSNAIKDAVIEYLWQIIDNIDTISDWAKGNDTAYRKAVEREQAKRWKTGITTDGYTLDMSTLDVSRMRITEKEELELADRLARGVEILRKRVR